MLSSPAQGRKVSFVLSKPTLYNVEDAPSAVPTSTSERTWTAGSCPTTAAVAPTVLRQPGGGTSSRPRTPAAPPHADVSLRPPTGRPISARPPPRESLENDDSESNAVDDEYTRGGRYDERRQPASRPRTPAAAAGSSLDDGTEHANAARARAASPGQYVPGDTPVCVCR